jgi:hypothetical protein
MANQKQMVWKCIGIVILLRTQGVASAVPQTIPKLYRTQDWALAAPREWRVAQPAGLQILHLSGDGTPGIPQLDAMLKPLQVGMALEVHGPGTTNADRVRTELLEELKRAPGGRERPKPTVEPMTLLDGTKAQLLAADVDKADEARSSVYLKLICDHPTGRVLVLSGWATGGRGSGPFIRKSGLLAYLKAHVCSLVLDPAKVGYDELKPAYLAYNWDLHRAIRICQRANGLLDHDRAGAIKAYNDAIGLCDSLSAAHNGLAWAVLSAPQASSSELKEGMMHAQQAVELTERQDPSALDTLALAHLKNGQRDRAMDAVTEGLKLDPADASLLKRREECKAAK